MAGDGFERCAYRAITPLIRGRNEYELGPCCGLFQAAWSPQFGRLEQLSRRDLQTRGHSLGLSNFGCQSLKPSELLDPRTFFATGS